jgi:AraC-like DNA-binding protein
MVDVMRVDVETSDRDEAVHAIEHVFGFRTAFTGKSLTFRQHSIIAPGVAFSELYFGGTMTVKVDPMDDVVIGDVPTGRYDLGLGPRSPEVTGRGLFIPPVDAQLHVDLEHTTALTYSIARDHLRRVAADLSPERSPSLDLTGMWPISASAASYWRQTADTYRLHVLEQDDLEHDDHDAGGLLVTEATRHFIASTLITFGMITPVSGSATDSIVIRRVKAFIGDHVQEPISLADLAAAAGVNIRTLQATCRRELGRTPLEYVREARLSECRREFLNPSTGLTIGEVARRWGFAHAGRFSTQYRQVYGEYPNETLSRTR